MQYYCEKQQGCVSFNLYLYAIIVYIFLMFNKVFKKKIFILKHSTHIFMALKCFRKRFSR